jgi:hypothetical protein
MALLPACSVQAVGISIWATSQSSGTPDQGKIHLGCAITLAGLGIQVRGCWRVLRLPSLAPVCLR